MGKHQKNFRKVPTTIRAKLATLTGDDVVVACVLRIPTARLRDFEHLGLTTETAVVTTVPPPEQGRYSKCNIEGREVVYKDRPMVKKTYSWETPNWGDWSNGSHTHSRTRDVYQRGFIHPRELPIQVVVLESRDDRLTVRFRVDQVLDRSAPTFDDDLFFNLNLLQENVGSVDVYSSQTPHAEYIATTRVRWEVLPPGSVDEVLRKMLSGKPPVRPEDERVMRIRLRALQSLDPEAYVAGTTGFLRYFGAKFGDDCVAFENLRHGNALYVMYEDWQELSQRSRIDLLRGDLDGFDRIEHRAGWQQRLRSIIRAYRERAA